MSSIVLSKSQAPLEMPENTRILFKFLEQKLRDLPDITLRRQTAKIRELVSRAYASSKKMGTNF